MKKSPICNVDFMVVKETWLSPIFSVPLYTIITTKQCKLQFIQHVICWIKKSHFLVMVGKLFLITLTLSFESSG